MDNNNPTPPSSSSSSPDNKNHKKKDKSSSAADFLIAYLAAKASQSAPAAGPPLVAFTAEFGSGFYWFAAYCVFSLASQQLTARVLAARD